MTNRPPILTAPNLLTLLRLVGAAVAIRLFRLGQGPAAAAVFAAAMLTDCVDGWAARRLKQESSLGLYLDPVVDKIVILALLYELAGAGVFPTAVPHLFLARELLHSAVRSVAALQGTVVGANWMGKTKAVLQTFLVLAGLLLPASAAAPLRAAVALSAWLVLAVSWIFFSAFAARNRSLLLRAGAADRSEPDAEPL